MPSNRKKKKLKKKDVENLENTSVMAAAEMCSCPAASECVAASDCIAVSCETGSTCEQTSNCETGSGNVRAVN